MSQITNQSFVSLSTTLIGQGSFGRVYLDTHNDKVFKKSDTFVSDKNNFIIIENNIRELVFYKFMKEKFDDSLNISSTGSYNPSSKQTFTLSYFLDNPDNISIPYNVELKNNISKIYLQHNGIPLSKYKYDSLNEIKLIFSEICRTIYSLYSKGMTHGDLKPSNILIKKDKIPSIKIIDFGSIQFNHYFKIKQPYQRCSLLYVSPEELCDFIYSLYNDWWSVGVIMFEVLTGRTFIECLMIEYKIDLKQIKLFFECIYKRKKIDNFNPLNYLTCVFKEIKQCHISKTISTYIKDDELKQLIMQFLVKDVNDRKLYVEHTMKTMYINKKVSKNKEKMYTLFSQHYFVPLSEAQQNLIEYNLSCFSYEKRKIILSVIYNICKSKDDFGVELYGHTVMLLDRVFTNWNKYLVATNATDDLEGELVSIICLIISRCIFKSTINRTNIVQELCEVYYDKKYSTEEVLDLMHFVICMLDFELYNVSPDLIIQSKGQNIDIQKIHESFIKYKIVNETTEKVYQILTISV